MDEMINILTRGIGIELVKPIRISYYDKKRYLEKDENYKNNTDDIKQFLIDMMAMSVFNQQVIVPLYGASNFGSATKEYGVKQVRMGSYMLDNNFYSEVDETTKQFYAITREYGIAIESLHISSISEFIEKWLKVVNNRG